MELPRSSDPRPKATSKAKATKAKAQTPRPKQSARSAKTSLRSSRARSTVGSAPKPSRALIVANAALASAAMSSQSLASRLRAMPGYADLFAKLGNPPDLPVPAPNFSGYSDCHKFTYLRGASATTNVSLPAGETGFVFIQPNRMDGLVFFDRTGGGGTTGAAAASRSWGRVGAHVDYDLTNWSYAAWKGASPLSMFINANAIKAGTQVKLPTGTTDHPPLMQAIATKMKVTVGVPIDGIAVAYVLTPADNPDMVGHNQQAHPYDISTSTLNTFGVDSAFLGATLGTHQPTDATAGVFMETHGKAKLMVGASNQSVHEFDVCGVSDRHWHFGGDLDNVDAPAGSTVSASNNFRPKNSYLACAHYGLVAVKNTGSVAVTVSFSGECTSALILSSDDSSQAIGSLAHNARIGAPNLTPNISRQTGKPTEKNGESVWSEVGSAFRSFGSGVYNFVKGVVSSPTDTNTSSFSHDGLFNAGRTIRNLSMPQLNGNRSGGLPIDPRIMLLE